AGIGGLAMAVFLLLFMAVIKNTKLFSTMSGDQTYKTIRHFLYLTFGIAVLGLAAWVYAQNLSASPKAPNTLPREVSFIGQNLTPDRLPGSIMEPSSGATGEALLRELSAKGSLTLDNSTLTLAPAGANVTVSLAVYTLTLINGSRVVTNGNGFRLQTARIV